MNEIVLLTVAGAAVVLAFAAGLLLPGWLRRIVAGRTRVAPVPASGILSDQRLDDFLDALPVPVFIKGQDLKYVHCNQAFANFMGLPRAAILGHDAEELWAPERAGLYHAFDRKLLAEGTQQVYQAPVRFADGQIRTCMFYKSLLRGDAASPQRIVGVMLDVSARRAEQEAQQLLSAAVEQASEIVVMTDVHGRIEYVNPAFEQSTGYSAMEVLGQTPAVLKSGDHPPQFYRDLWSTISAGHVWRGRFTNRRKDGALYHEQAAITPVRDEHGAIAHYVAVKLDITQEVAREAQMRQVQKMEAIGTLAGGIAHDFNNMLFAILGYAELTRDSLAAGDPARENIDELIGAALRGKELVQQILSFSRQSDEQVQLAPVAPLVKEVLRMMRATLPTSVSIALELAVADTLVQVSPSEVHQVLMNLCTNAVQAMPERRGKLALRAYERVLDTQQAQAHPNLYAGMPYVVLEVEDDGSGIAPADLERIFDPFFTTKEVGQGTGLGLAVVHGIAARHNGCVLVESKLGQGSRFSVYLPAQQGEAPAAPPATTASNGGTEHLLLVDDDLLVLSVTRRVLEGLGYCVTTAGTPEQALALLRGGGQQYDVLVTDQVMPQLTGLELIEQARLLSPRLPVVLCTGQGQTLDGAALGRLAPAECIGKPVLRADLDAAVRRVLHQSLETVGTA